MQTITHSTGRSLTLNYGGVSAASPITSITSASQTLATYAYTANAQIETVTYPDAGVRRYHYEDSRFPQNLTGVTDEDSRRFSTFAYDAQGRLIDSAHAGGVDKVSLVYSAQGGALVTDALGDSTDYRLTTAGASDKPRKAGDLSDSKGTVGRSYYSDSSDFRRRIDTVTDRRGMQTKHNYATASDPVTGQPAWIHTIVEAVGTPETRTSEERRDSASNRVILSRLADRETRVVRNARHQPVSIAVRDITTNAVRTTTLAYCEAADVAVSNSVCPMLGLPKSIDGPRTDVADVTTFEYYGADDSTCATTPGLCTYRKSDLRKITDALGHSMEILGYDPQGRPLSVMDANAAVTDFVYTPRGWLTKTKQRGADDGSEQDDRITEITHRRTGLPLTISMPGKTPTALGHDDAGRLVSVDRNDEGYIDYTLDLAGNLKKQENRTGSGQLTHTFSRVYNLLGQLEIAKDASQNPTTLRYDANGNSDRTTDALGRKTDQSYDPLNRLVHTVQDIDGLHAETRLKYNALDQVTQVTDPKGLNTTYVYNGFGEQTRLTSPDTGVADYTYNVAGLLTTKHDANDASAHRYGYDALNRPKAIFYAANGPADVEYDYDTVNAECTSGENFALGRVTAMRTEGTELKYCYDRFGQAVRKVQIVAGRAFTLRYAYDKAGLLQAVTYPDGAVADYWRPDGRIQQVYVTPAGGTRTRLLDDAFYQPFGPSMGWSYGNGRYLMIDTDLDYRTKSIRDSAIGGLSLGYGYNTVGELTELKDGTQTSTLTKYDYDTLGRLAVTRDGGSNTAIETYEYDLTGNRKKLAHGTIVDNYDYPTDSHRLTGINTAGGSNVSRSYDAIGNTTAIGGTARQFVFNANDRMRQVKQNGVVTMGYRYNAKGERVAAIGGDSGPVTTYTLYDEAGKWIGDYDSTGATIQQAVWMDNLPVGLLAGAGTAQTLKYVQPDHLGTPRAVIDPIRNVAIWTWDAKGEAFGNSPPNQDPDLDGIAFVFNMRFPGQFYDVATGLNYNYFRDYDPTAARYVESDPIGLRGGIGSYVYGNGNPLSNADSSGLICHSADGMTTCTYPAPDGPSFRLPTPDGFPENIGPKYNILYHAYKQSAPLGCADPAEVFTGLVRNPTPGEPSPASPMGTRNNAVVMEVDNFVTSYFTTDLRTGEPLVVNITDGKSLFSWGYVARSVSRSFGHTWGEGTNWKQTTLIAGSAIQDLANSYVWGLQMRKIISECKCSSTR